MANEPKPLVNLLRSYWQIICIVMVSLIIRLFTLGTQSVWLDEAISLRVVMRPIAYAFTFIDPTPPLYYVLLSAWYHIFHGSLLSAYLFSVIAGVGVVIAIYFFTRRFFSEKAALIASMLAAVNPALIYYSQEIRAYSLFFLVAIISVYAYLNYRESPTNKNAFWYVLSAALLLYVHIYGAIIFFSQVLDFFVYWFNTRAKRVLMRTCVLFLAILLIYIPWLLRLHTLISQGSGTWIVVPNLFSLWYLSRTYVAGNVYSHFYFPAIILFLSILLFGLIFFTNKTFSKSKSKFDMRMFSLLFMGALVVLIPFFISILILPFFTTRYALVSLVFFIPAASFVIQKISPRTLRFTVIGVLIISCLGAGSVQSQSVLKDDWRQVAADISQESMSKLPIMITPAYNAFALGYYVNPTCLGSYDGDDDIYNCLAVKSHIYTINELGEGLPFKPNSFLLVADQRINSSEGELFFASIRTLYDIRLLKIYELHTSSTLSPKIQQIFDGDSSFKSEFSHIYVFEAKIKDRTASALTQSVGVIS